MSQIYVFTPQYGRGVSVTPSTTSAGSTIGKKLKQFVVTNMGSSVCYVRPSIGVSQATTADYPVLGNTQVTLTKDENADTINYVTASGTGSLHIIAGEGF